MYPSVMPTVEGDQRDRSHEEASGPPGSDVEPESETPAPTILKRVSLTGLLNGSGSGNGNPDAPATAGARSVDLSQINRPRYLQDLVWPDDIPLSPLASTHHFAALIQKDGFITLDELQSTLTSGRFQLDMGAYESGVLPAATNDGKHDPDSHLASYMCHGWTRDVAISSLAMKRAGQKTGDCSDGVAALKSLWQFYARPEQRDKLLSFVLNSDQEGYDPKSWYHDESKVPHIRARIEDGALVESQQSWGHQQLDAFGMWLFTAFRFANDELIDLRAIAQEMSETVCPASGVDSILSLSIKFLNRIEFWDQRDFGPWEDFCLPQRATSVGCCVAALGEAIRFFENHPAGYNAIPTDNAEHFASELHNAYNRGLETLTRRIPHNGELAVETDQYPSDAAMLFLLYPFHPDLTEAQESAILKRAYEQHDGEFTRIGAIGISRRDNDDYVGQDYIYARNPNPAKDGTFADMNVENYKPAEWTLFDGLLAGFYARKFIGSRGEDSFAYAYMQRHLKRMLSHPTADSDTLHITATDASIPIDQHVVPEAYFLDTRENRWRANHNTPLLMSNAAHALALERVKDAIQLHEILGANPL